MFPPVGFPEPPPAPAVPVSGQRALHKPRHGSCGSSCRGRPRSRDHCAPVSVARGAHLRRVEQRPFGCRSRWPRPPRCSSPRRRHRCTPTSCCRCCPVPRTEEVRALCWEHVDLTGDPDATPPVPPSVSVLRSVSQTGDTKTRRSRRRVAIPCRVVDALLAHRNRLDQRPASTAPCDLSSHHERHHASTA